MNIILSNSSDKPIYAQITEQIVNQIVNGELASGEALPSIRILSRDLKISVITTKRAYEELERDGYIETVVGKGTFVSGINKELLKERQMDIIERDLLNVIDSVKKINLTKQEFQNLIDILWD